MLATMALHSGIKKRNLLISKQPTSSSKELLARNKRLAHRRKNTSASAKKGLVEDKVEMLMGSQDIESVDTRGLRRRLRWRSGRMRRWRKRHA
jgi:hypothetical protein